MSNEGPTNKSAPAQAEAEPNQKAAAKSTSFAHGRVKTVVVEASGKRPAAKAAQQLAQQIQLLASNALREIEAAEAFLARPPEVETSVIEAEELLERVRREGEPFRTALRASQDKQVAKPAIPNSSIGEWISGPDYDNSKYYLDIYGRIAGASVALIGFIEEQKQSERSETDHRIQLAAEKLGVDPAQFAEVLSTFFPETLEHKNETHQPEQSASAPARTSARWAEREPEDTPASFVRKHYGVWRDGGWEPGSLTMADLRADMQLYNAMAQWVRRHPEDALPTKKQVNDTWAERVRSDPEAAAEVREMRRRLRNLERRERGS